MHASRSRTRAACRRALTFISTHFPELALLVVCSFRYWLLAALTCRLNMCNAELALLTLYLAYEKKRGKVRAT